MKIYLAVAAIMNYIFVLIANTGSQAFVYAALPLALLLFIHDVPKGTSKPLRFVGALFNFFGVVGGIGVHATLTMAVFGGALLLVYHVSDIPFSKKNSSPS